MNEVIVWDEEKKEFSESKIVDGWLLHKRAFNQESKIKMFPYIGKTDIDGKKIYADSSIVEFEVIERCCCDILEVHCECDFNKRIGYFNYNEDRLCFELKSKENDCFDSVFAFYRDRIKNLKIIDTLQENKLGLIGDKDEN